MHPKDLGNPRKDIKIVFRFVLRRYALAQREDIKLRIVAAHVHIVTLVGGGHRQYDVRVFRRRRPVRFVHHHGFRMLPGFHQVVGILMLVEGVTARHVHHFNIRIGDLCPVIVDGLAWVRQRIGDARHRERRNIFRRRRRWATGGDPRQNTAARGWATAGRVVIAKAETAAGQANLPQHRRQRHHHPVGLFAMMLTLNAPAAHDHGAMLRHISRQLLDSLSINAADIRSPVGIFDDAIFFTVQVGFKFIEPYGVGFQEIRVMQIFSQQRMGHPRHQRAVGVAARGDPLGA